MCVCFRYLLSLSLCWIIARAEVEGVSHFSHLKVELLPWVHAEPQRSSGSYCNANMVSVELGHRRNLIRKDDDTCYILLYRSSLTILVVIRSIIAISRRINFTVNYFSWDHYDDFPQLLTVIFLYFTNGSILLWEFKYKTDGCKHLRSL